MATVLVVDDRPPDRDLLSTLLTYRGHRVLEAANGEEALAALSAQRIQLVVSDVMMPRMDGYELVRRMRETPALAHVPVLFYSATYLPHELAALADTLRVRVLTKPSEPDAILEAIDAALAARVGPPVETGEAFDQAHLRLLTDKLVETQESLMVALNGSSTGLWTWDLATHRVSVSPNMMKLLGFRGDETFTGDDWLARVHDADRAAVERAIAACVEGRTPTYESEYRLRRQDGGYGWMLTRGTCQRGPDGQPLRLTGSTVDVTRLKLAEADAVARSRHAAFVADVSLALTEGGSERDMLDVCARALVRHLDATLARIWTLDASGAVLELQASAGLYTHLNGAHGRVPLGEFKIGRIARDRRAHLTNQVLGDPQVHDQAWARRERIVSFAGYPMLVSDRLVGVMAMFGRVPMSRGQLDALEAVSRTLALGIERRRLEDARERFQELLETTTDLVTIGRPNGPPLFVNRAARRAFGLTLDEPVRSLLDFRPAGFDQRFFADIVPGVVRDGSWSGDTEYVSRTGVVVPVSQVSIAHRGSGGVVDYISTISRDITTQRQSAATLQEAEERTRFALEAARAMVWVADPATGAVSVSDSIRVVHGVSKEQFGGTIADFLALIHPDDRAAVSDALRQVNEQIGDFTLDFRSIWPDGTTHWVESRGRVLRDDAAMPLEVIGIAQDVSERRQLEAQLQQAQKIEAVGQLAGGLAHDFNNLLTVILGYAHLLGERLEDDPRRGDLDEIVKAGYRATQLMRQLLAFGRKQVFQASVIDLNALLHDIRNMLGTLVGEHIDVALALDPALDAIKADPSQLEQVLVNLAVNARDAMPRGGKLTIETRNVELDETYASAHVSVAPGRYVLLAVTDTGTGIADDVLPRIFEPFYTTKERGKGTGMGLASVFGIVKQSGGVILVYSEVGVGTSFKVYLPPADQTAGPAAAIPAASAAPGGTETILVVEDDALVRGLVQVSLARLGYRVIMAEGADEAVRILEAAAAPHVDLLLTDVVMPGRSGSELYSQVRAAHPDIRVLYMSGFADDAVVRQGVLQADTPFLQKPFTGPALALKVRDVLD